MNTTTSLVLIVLTTLLFLIFMIYHNIKKLFSHDQSFFGVQSGLNNVRYIIMFMSFEATMILMIRAGQIFIENYRLSTLENTSFFILVVFVSVFVSLIITSTMVSAERAFAEGKMSKIQIQATAVTYIVFAFIDFSSIKVGASMLLDEIQAKEISQLSQHIEKKSDFILDNKKQVILSLKEELQDIATKFKNINTIQVTSKRINSLNAQIARYDKKGKPCPNTRAALHDAIETERKRIYANFTKRKATIENKIINISNSYEGTAITVDKNKEEQILKIKAKTEDIRAKANLVAFVMLSIGFIFSALGVFVAKEEETEEIEEEETEPQQTSSELSEYEKKSCVQKAIREIATERNETMSDHLISDPRKITGYGRNLVKNRAIEVAERQRFVFAWSNGKIDKTISSYLSPNSEFRKWLSGQCWNNRYGEKSIYYEQYNECKQDE